MNTTRRGMLLGVPAALVAASARAQSSDWNAVLAGAKREGRLVFYTGAPEQVTSPILTGFRKTYPDVPIEMFRGPSGEVISKLDRERAAGIDGADVALATEVAWFTARGAEGGLIAPRGPARAAWPDVALLPGGGLIVGREPIVIAYNTEIVKSPPRSYAELLGPEYRNKLGSSELASTVLIAWYDFLERTQGPEYLPKLKAQNVKMYNGSVPGAQAVAAGEISVDAFGVPTAIRPLAAQGAPIAYTVPSPGLGNQYAAGALAWSKRPNAALLFLDFVMSRDGQSAWHGQGGSASPLRDIKGGLDFDAITPYDPAAWTPEKIAAYRARWNTIFR